MHARYYWLLLLQTLDQTPKRVICSSKVDRGIDWLIKASPQQGLFLEFVVFQDTRWSSFSWEQIILLDSVQALEGPFGYLLITQFRVNQAYHEVGSHFEEISLDIFGRNIAWNWINELLVLGLDDLKNLITWCHECICVFLLNLFEHVELFLSLLLQKTSRCLGHRTCVTVLFASGGTHTRRLFLECFAERFDILRDVVVVMRKHTLVTFAFVNYTEGTFYAYFASLTEGLCNFRKISSLIKTKRIWELHVIRVWVIYALLVHSSRHTALPTTSRGEAGDVSVAGNVCLFLRIASTSLRLVHAKTTTHGETAIELRFLRTRTTILLKARLLFHHARRLHLWYYTSSRLIISGARSVERRFWYRIIVVSAVFFTYWIASFVNIQVAPAILSTSQWA